MKLGHKLHGQGNEKVIVMNDWFSDCTSYEPTLPYLNQDSFQFALTDLRGYGASIDLNGQFDLDEATQDIIDTADSLGWKQFDLIGYSMTGLVGQNVVATVKERVKSFIGICPVSAEGMPGADDDFYQFMRFAAESNDEYGLQIAHMVTSHRHGHEWAKFKVRRWRETSVVAARVNYLNMFVRSNIVEKVKGSNTPVLIITTSDDIESLRRSAIDAKFRECFANVEFAEITNAGHSPMMETPVSLATLINKFLKDKTCMPLKAEATSSR